jgi:hypothetical protein
VLRPPLKLIATTAAMHILYSYSPLAGRCVTPVNPLQKCHFSGISRTSRSTILSIQRFLSRFPPAISADLLHKLRNLRIEVHKKVSNLPLNL